MKTSKGYFAKHPKAAAPGHRKRKAAHQSKKEKSKSPAQAAQSNSSQLKTALEYANRWMRVAPVHGTKDGLCTCGDKKCKRPGQHLRTPNGIEDATRNPEEIEKLWSEWPKAKIAIATGVEEVIALRVTGEAPQAALAEFLSSANTVQVIDGNVHIYLWKMPPETVPDGRVVLREGVEVLGSGKYFVAPNDLNTNGGKRRFAVGGVIGQADIAPTPDWLLARLRPHLLGINAKLPSPGSERVMFKTVTIDVNCLAGGNDPCDSEEVLLRTLSISETGPRRPPAVRRLDGETPLYAVLTDRCEVQALKALGATTIDCIVVDADDDGAFVWQLAELFNQPQKTVLQRAELAMKCVEIVRRRGGQHAQGVRQPNDKGLSTAERILGVSRRDLGRFEKIDGISAEAKEEARRAGLDDNQNALLAIADVPPEKQVEKVLELEEQYAGGRRKRSAPAKSKKSALSPAAADQEPADVEDSDEPETDAYRSSAASTDDAEDDADESEASADSPPIVPADDGLGIPPFLRRTDEEKIKATLQSIYDHYLAPDWPDIPMTLQLWFVTEVLRLAYVNSGKT